MVNEQRFSALCKRFGIQGSVKGFEIVRFGHINGTYDVAVVNEGVESHFFFQRVNTFVFKEPTTIMSNIRYVTEHIAKKLEQLGESRDGVMHFLDAEDGNNYLIEGDEFWRVSEAVPNALTINQSSEPAILKTTGTGFGRFQTLLADFDASLLYETIPNFHNTRARIELFETHVPADPCGRVAEVEQEIAIVRRLSPLACRLGDLLREGKLPLHGTHNATKINNIIFDKDTKISKCVIDLDTIMPGLVAHDFGDAIRFGANTAKEDESDLSKVSLNIDLFRAFAEGFLAETHKSLTPTEIETLALGAFTMTFEVGLRFLDDYLVGDTYFKTAYEGHNLVRARCQLHLAEDMAARMDEMNAVIADIVKNLA